MQTPAGSGGFIILKSVLISSLNALQLPGRSLAMHTTNLQQNNNSDIAEILVSCVGPFGNFNVRT